MKKLLFFLFLASTVNVLAQKAKPITLKELQEMMARPSDKIQVFNFWATWCGPCVKELPELEKANGKAAVNLISLDYDLDKKVDKVNRFIAKKGLKSPVYFLKAGDPNSWISKIDSRWTGGIPATIIIYPNSEKREFILGGLKPGELESLLNL